MEGKGAEAPTENKANQVPGVNYIAVEVSERGLIVSINDGEESERLSMQSPSSAADLVDNPRPVKDSNSSIEKCGGTLCPDCKTKLGPDCRFCFRCGRKVQEDTVSETNVSQVEANTSGNEPKTNNVIVVAREIKDEKQVALLGANSNPFVKAADNSQQLSLPDIAKDEKKGNLTDVVQPNTGEVTPNTVGELPNTGEVTHNTVGTQPNTGKVSPNAIGVQPNTGEVNQNTVGTEPETDEVSLNIVGELQNTGEVNPNPAGVQQNTSGVFPNTASGQPKTDDVIPNTVNVQASTGEVIPNAAGVQQNTAEVTENIVGIQPNAGEVTQNGVIVQTNTGEVTPNPAGVQQNTSEITPNTASVQPKTDEVISNTAAVQANTGKVTPNSVGVQQHTGDIIPNTVGKRPNTGEVTQNTVGAQLNMSEVSQNTVGEMQNTSEVTPNPAGLQQNTSDVTPNTASVQPKTDKVIPNTTDVQQNTAGAQPNTDEVSPNTVGELQNTGEVTPTPDVQQNTSEVTPNTASVQPNTSEVTSNTVGVQKNTGEPTPNSGGAQPNTGEVIPNTAVVQANTGEVTPNAGEVTPNAGEVKPNTGEVNPNTAGVQANTGEVTPHAGAVQPNNGGVTPNVGDIGGNGNGDGTQTLLELVRKDPKATNSTEESTTMKTNYGQPGERPYRKEDKNEVYMAGTRNNKENKGRNGQNTAHARKPEQEHKEKCLTVAFHAVLSSKFKGEEEIKVQIRGGDPVFYGWKYDGIPMKTKEYRDGHLYVNGQFKVSLQCANERCPYKYVVVKKSGKVFHEQLVEFTFWDEIVNRCLVIPKEYHSENKIFKKFDGFIYPKPKSKALTWLFGPSGSPIADRRTLLRDFFPKWSGFHVNSRDNGMQPLEALQSLNTLVHDISSVWTYTNYDERQIVDSEKLKLWELFQEILMPKVHRNLKVLDSEISDVRAKVDALVSSVAITYALTAYLKDSKLEFEQRQSLMKCLRLPLDRDVCVEFMKRISVFDGSVISSFIRTIVKFYKQQSWTKRLVCDWLLALPLLHFLRRDSEPFEDVICKKSDEFGTWKWWGLKEFPCRDIRRNITASEAIAMLPGLKDMFNMDRLLKRTFLLLCPVEIYGELLKTGCFSCLELCVTLRKLLSDTTTNSSYTPTFVNDLSLLFKKINETLLLMSAEKWSKQRTPETMVLLQSIVYLVQNVKQHLKIDQVEMFCRLGECLATVIVLQVKGIDFEEKSDENISLCYDLKDIPKDMFPFFEELVTLVEAFMDLRLPVFFSEREWDRELKAWNQLLSLSVPEIFYKQWHKKFMNKFQSRIMSKFTPFQVLEVFCQSEQNCHPDIATFLSDTAFKIVEDLVRPSSWDQGEKAFTYLSREGGSYDKRISLLSRMLEKAWPLKDENAPSENDVLLKHVLTWQTWPGFFKFFGGRGDSKRILTQKANIMMARAETLIEVLVKSVHDGSVTIATLDHLERNSGQFLRLGEIYEANQSAVGNRNLVIQVSYRNRVAERKEFSNLQKQLKCFIGMCNNFEEDEEIATLRRKVYEDVDQIPINNLCARTSAGIVVVFFGIDPGLSEMITQSFAFQNSRIFNELWRNNSKKLKKKATMGLIFTNVWQTTREELVTVKELFLSGEMKLTAVNDYLKMFGYDYGGLQEEFELLPSKINNMATRFGNQKLLTTRIQQVRDYNKLFHAREAARAILELKVALELEGDFEEVDDINKIIIGKLSSQPIKSIDKKILDAGKFLEDLTPEKANCLKAFQQCSKMVTWLRENIKDQQELKVFVDLAMISAGEDDMEIDRISCMHTSCLGFGSLIFELKPYHGFNDLMDLCKPVWQAVKANPTLGEKLKITNIHLPWLMQIKESHGSVALTTLMQVEAINSCGAYYIGDKQKAKESKHGRDDFCLENLICLVVPEDTLKQREEKVYTLEEVKDVQSKLMLIAGKAESGKDDVDQFLEVFEGVLRIGELYLQLCEVGDINYLTWKKKFQSSKLGDQREQLLESIKHTCNVMESSFKIWKNEIDKMRASCYSLNHFTVKQILKLRKELAKACTGELAVDELPLQTFMLLESVNKDVEPLLLANILKSAIPDNSIFITEDGFYDDQKYFTREVEIKDIEEENDKHEMRAFNPLTQTRRNSLEIFNSAKEKLEGMGNYREECVVAALQDCGRNATEEDLIAWVLFGENDDETVMKLCEDAKRNLALSDILEDVSSQEYEAVGEDEMGDDNITVYERPKVVPKTDKPYVHNEEDTYLALEALADILETLCAPESQSVHRKLPSNLKEGEPNLLLVPKGEVFGYVLSLFMGPKKQPLPTDEEVIVCDENTTAEEIELLWRRAVVAESGLLFCLANADLLDYDVSQQAVRSLEMVTQGRSKYHLVVICSIENEDKSNIVASLDQYRRQFLPLTSFKCVKKYLKEQLMSSDTKKIGDIQWKPAASVDRERLSVRVVQSSRAGMGKSLIVKHLAENLNNLPNNQRFRRSMVTSLCPTIPIYGISVDSGHVTRTLLKHAVKPDIPVSRIFHLDMSQSVSKGLDDFLFKLVILRAVKDCSGNVWRRKSTDMYIVEITTDKSFATLTADEHSSVGTYSQNARKKLATNKYSFVKFLPRTHCLTPRETLNNLKQNREGNTGFDMEKFHSEEYQRTIQYLTHFASDSNLDRFFFIYEPRVIVFGDPVDALTILIKYCGIRDPSWAELDHFVNFLNIQLRDCEESVFCNAQLVGDLLQGFRTFAVRFMIQMSRDFATRSLSDNNLGVVDASTPEEDDLAPFQMRRRWEKSPHPYIFFNQDRNSMTFLGFRLSNAGDLLDPSTNDVLEHGLMDPTLRGQLKLQGVDFDANYETRDRDTRIANLCSVMGIAWSDYDPDPTYELTIDNVEKILAIHMRFRCGIPVIIMGETGCGKTRLIRFMCELQAGPDRPKNMLLMKVHGGTTYAEIQKKVEDAEKLASCNKKINVDTILFFDEANTTDAIDLIKEIMVERRVNGRAIDPKLTRLHFIAACNPYRKHTKEMIQKLESAGLGYHVSADETEDKLGSIPLRQLVYRVHPLPESMRPLVWDFGQLTDHTEELYTKQIVRRFVKSPTLHQLAAANPALECIHGSDDQASCIADILSASQKFMRRQEGECSFVSLRDVERAMKVMTWFYAKWDLITRIIGGEDNTDISGESSEYDSEETANKQPLTQIVGAVILGIGVCYYARLNIREPYCREICKYFVNPFSLPGGAKRMQSEIMRCQQAFLKDVQLGHNIAKNTALSENVFMMAICTELRIPLFVVGKPGSSKSLAKDVISTNMKAANSQSELFLHLKQIHMQSYQCSPLSTPQGIVSTFKQCAKLQKDKDLKKFVSVVVLDEIGLAEDSPLMPLKALHPLLEDGTATAEESGAVSDHQRVGFIGLSNWALDPAKMNRGIILSRGMPDKRELCDSARGICSGDKHVQRRLKKTIKRLSKGYFKLYRRQQSESKTLQDAQKDEFFGLRDFYSLVKMVYGFAVQAKGYHQVSDVQLEISIRRNFSGLDDLNPAEIFYRFFPRLRDCPTYPTPECLPVNLIRKSLGRGENEGESRYLLVLTENYAALRLLQREFLKGKDQNPVVIFGSSFPKDQHYTQICRNINRIKVCMETGRMVILLNLESLYESLYDALNQYYVYLDEQKYVDLGLGNHRVKCRVAKNFKLIVVAEKDVVYQRFPIPLINRLEKHLLVMSTGLTERQVRLVRELEDWVQLFSDARPESNSAQCIFKPGDSFVGYHSDTAAAVVIKMSLKETKPDDQILSQSKQTLLQIASPDAIARVRATKLKHNADQLWTEYFENQKHGSLKEYLIHCLGSKETENEGSLVQITTYSRLLSQANSRAIATAARFAGSQCRCISLQEFNTEQQFTKTIGEFFVQLGGAEGLLLVQCDNGETNFNLIACCRYLVDETRRRILEDIDESVKPIHIVFIIQLPKIAGGCQHFVGFQGGKWQSVHIDELLESNKQAPQIEQLISRSVSDLFQTRNVGKNDDVENLDVDEDLDSSPTTNIELHAGNTENLNENEVEEEEIKPTVLLKSCLQAAAARIYDESPELDRATKRIQILLECLPEDNEQETELSTILTARIYQLLQQRDDRCFQDQRLWLQHEALCQGHLQETGTFRKALWQKLSSIVSPMLSEVIAYCDRNSNLDVLCERNDWKSQLWFAMLNEAQVTPLSYDSFISPVSRKLRERAFVQNTGKGHYFKAKFPFSWIIKDMVQVLLLNTKIGVPFEKLVSLRGVLYSSPLGKLLKPIFEDKEFKIEAAKTYLNDFLHMMYKPRVEGELQLIYDAVVLAAGNLHQLLHENDELDLDIPLIHFAHSFIEPRLANFSELVLAFPEVVKKILKMRQKLDVGEMILDVVALECCLQQLEPNPWKLEQRDDRLIWCNRVQSIRPIIVVMKSLILRPSQLQQGHTNTEASFEVQRFGERAAHLLLNCRATWIRIDVVRLFIEHTCPPGQSTQSADPQNAFILWKALGDNPDFSTVHTMAVIERFLKECRFDISLCEICKKPLQDPVQMPCDHICCLSCVNGWFMDHTTCPVCRNEVGEGFKVEVNRRYRKAIEIYNGFRNRCKSFFMELVSQYCFGEQLPDANLVKKFIGYVIKDENTTEEFTPFVGQGIDVTPVIRSFILQQLLGIKGREKEVLGHLKEYLHRASGLAGEREHLIEVCVLCVQCMEDVETVKLLKGKVAGENVEILLTSRILDGSLKKITHNTSPNTLNVEALQSIAGIRAALDVLSTYLGDDFVENVKRLPNLSKCLETARHLCSNESGFPIKLFLLKQLVRHDQSGIDAVKERCKKKELKWIMPPQSEGQDTTPDTFIVHHDNYHIVREALAKAILTSNIDDFDLIIQNLQAQPFARSCYVLLALFREVTTCFTSNNKKDGIPVKVLQKLTHYVAGVRYLPNDLKYLAEYLLTNFENANSHLLRLNPQQPGSSRQLIEVLVHFRIVMECLPHNQLLQPLRNLAINPAMMMNCFIPTMPHDYGLEAMQADIQGTWYECPNGHRYLITECGKPNQGYDCPTCNARIGGANDTLAANNRNASRQDRTSTGHILGRANAQQQTVTSERNLTPLACGVLRCLTHAAMLLGTDQDIQGITAVIKPPVQDVVQFLTEHLHHDIRCIARSTGHNDNEAIQIIHLVLVGIINNLNQQQGNVNVDARLRTKESRTAWENVFMTTYLNPILSAITNLLQDSFGRMVRDERLGNNRLMRLLHELDSPNYETITNLDPMCPALWRYRKKITIEYLSFNFQEYSQGRNASERCKILEEFLKKEHLLRALQYLPDILKLQRLLSEKFYRRLDRNEAEKHTLGDFLRRAPGMKEQVNALVHSFRMAWKILRSSLIQNGRYSISQELCSLEVKSSTPISTFLPALSGKGLCASAMTDFLVTLHNNFIGRCKHLLNDESSSPEISLTNITKAHLVAYDPDKDLLPMIFAHCDYSLKVGEGTVVEFNWKGLERQLVDRFIRGRPRLTSLVELFVFSKDICDGEVFKTLKQKIPQVDLSRPVQDQILNELNQLTDVCDVLKSLHIAIGFLSSAGGDPLMSIHDYLHSGLKMAPKDCLKSTKAEQFCQLQHIVSLWLLLSLERARVLTKRTQDPFDDVSEKVKLLLDKKQKFYLNSGLQKLNVDYFVRELLEAILLYLKNAPQDQLHFPLSQYINTRLEDKSCDVIDSLEEHIPEDITVEHAVEAWKVACHKSEDYHSKMQQ